MPNPATIDLLEPAQRKGVGFLQPGGADTSTPEALNKLFGDYISVILQGLMAIALLSVFIFLIWGAFEWISGGGDKTKVESARNKITGAIIGLVVLSAVVAIFFLIQNFFGVHIFTITQPPTSEI